MNKHDKQVIESQLEDEKAVLKDLERQYKRALHDINERIRILQSDDSPSRAYQADYQKTLKAQVEAILEKLHADEYDSIHKYLSNSYTSGYVGAMYSMGRKSGIHVITPLDQKAAVKAIVTDSKLSVDLYAALGYDMDKLKKHVREEITRGIATSLPYEQIARNISGYTSMPLSNANRIVRTEGHRIQQASADDARNAAKAKGADVVKQWDASLDGATRKLHRELDGQIREVDEPFEAGGKKVMYPGKFGTPDQDCNCRCVALTRARWALDENELQTLKERAKFFDLDKEKDFEEYKKKYLKGAADVVYLDNPYVIDKELPPHVAEYPNYNDYRAAVEAYIKKHGSMPRYSTESEWAFRSSLSKTQKDNIKRLDLTVEQLHEAFPLHSKSGDHLIIGDYQSVKYRLNEAQLARVTGDAQAQAWNVPEKNMTVIGFETTGYDGTLLDDLKKRNDTIKAGKALERVLDASSEGVAIHEYGHLMSDYVTDGYVHADEAALEYWDWYKSLSKKEIREGVSIYATTNRNEFEAECFAELLTGEPRSIAKKYGEYLKKISGGKIDFSRAKAAKTVEKPGKSGIIKVDLSLFGEKDLKNQKTSSLRKAMTSFEAQIVEHQNKIADPVKYVPDWDSKDVREQKGLLKHWEKEIKNFRESIDNRIAELKERGEYDE